MGNDAKRLILARRARFIAAALASATAGATACGGKSEPCLSLALQDAGSVEDAQPQVCLSPPSNLDSGTDGAADADADALPQPCLSPPADDAGDQ